jgi:hypothetical protein
MLLFSKFKFTWKILDNDRHRFSANVADVGESNHNPFFFCLLCVGAFDGNLPQVTQSGIKATT